MRQTRGERHTLDKKSPLKPVEKKHWERLGDVIRSYTPGPKYWCLPPEYMLLFSDGSFHSEKNCTMENLGNLLLYISADLRQPCSSVLICR